MRWRLPILAWGEGCTFAAGRTACSLAADLKLTRIWSCSCLLQLTPVQYTEVHWLVLEAQPTVASRFEKDSLSWCSVSGACKTRWGQGRGKDTLGNSKLCDYWAIGWLSCSLALLVDWRAGIHAQHLRSVQGFEQNLMYKPVLRRKVNAPWWESLKVFCCHSDTVGIAYNGNSVPYA